MRLLLNTETERELAAGLPAANEPGITESDLEEVGDWLTERACESLARANITWSHAYAQSVGTCVIIQSATDDEREVWDKAIEQNRAKANEMLLRRLAST